jgi:hypothetical protein
MSFKIHFLLVISQPIVGSILKILIISQFLLQPLVSSTTEYSEGTAAFKFLTRDA